MRIRVVGLAKFFLGRGEETEAHIHEAFRLSPRDIICLPVDHVCRCLQIVARRRRGSGRLAASGPRGQSKFSHRAFHSRCRPGVLGHVDQARAAVQAGLALDPNFTIRRYRVSAPSSNPIYLAGRERFYQGMRMAGVPEG